MGSELASEDLRGTLLSDYEISRFWLRSFIIYERSKMSTQKWALKNERSYDYERSIER